MDRDCLETPFLVQGFIVETLDDIDLLAQYCEHVWVDQTISGRAAIRSSSDNAASRLAMMADHRFRQM